MRNERYFWCCLCFLKKPDTEAWNAVNSKTKEALCTSCNFMLELELGRGSRERKITANKKIN